jgi:hypothetical protein
VAAHLLCSISIPAPVLVKVRRRPRRGLATCCRRRTSGLSAEARGGNRRLVDVVRHWRELFASVSPRGHRHDRPSRPYCLTASSSNGGPMREMVDHRQRCSAPRSLYSAGLRDVGELDFEDGLSGHSQSGCSLSRRLDHPRLKADVDAMLFLQRSLRVSRAIPDIIDPFPSECLIKPS